MVRQVRKLSNQKKRVYRGIVHVQAGHHNTIVTITNIRGEVLCWSSAGACGFKGKENLQVSAKKAETAQKKNRVAMREAKYLCGSRSRSKVLSVKYLKQE
jgi:small subunit ribosomal protein S11